MSIPPPRAQVDEENAMEDIESITHNVFADLAHSEPDDFTRDPFIPLSHDESSPATSILTLRAIILGSVCGALVNASNIYLGLKTGWTSSANILGSIIGFAVLKNVSSKAGHSFGIHENNIVQTVATASGGMSNVFVSAMPALYQLGLLRMPAQDFFRTVSLTAVGGYFGLLSIVPLRRLFIKDIARELNLIFPSSSAVAITIRSMHSAASGAAAARQKLQATLHAFLVAMILRVLSQYAAGVLWDWHVFTWLRASNILTSIAISGESWGWAIEWSPALIGSGMLVGTNVASSFIGGSVIAWGIIGPYLVSHGMAYGERVDTGDPNWEGLASHTSMSSKFANADHPSARYWLLWPGVICMLAVAFTELACQYSIFWLFLCATAKHTKSSLVNLFKHTTRTYEYKIITPEPGNRETNVVSPVPQEEDDNIPAWMWMPGLAATIILCTVVTNIQFDMSVPETLLSLALAFSLSLVAIQATGATDTTPLTAVSKVSQVLLSSTTQGGGLAAAQRLNLLGGALTNIGAGQASDLMGDFRVGFLLRTPPRLQYAAQLIGTLVAALVAPAVFVLFTSAYPCILAPTESDVDEGALLFGKMDTRGQQQADYMCEFSGPSIATWRAVAVAVTESTLPVPAPSLVFSLIMAAVGCVSVLIRNFLWAGRWKFMRVYHPNMMVVAMAFTLPSARYGIAMMMGAVAAAVWRRRDAGGWERLGIAVASGLVAGEGIGGSLNALLAIVGLGGREWGTNFGCPAGRC